MYSTYLLREALNNGSKKGYTLFPEIREKKSIKKIKNHEVINKTFDKLKSYVSNLKESTPSISFDMFMEFEKTGNRLIYENAYFTRRKQLFSLVLTYVVEDDDKLINFIEEKLWEWCELYSWELPAHIPLTLEAVEKEGIDPGEYIGLFAAELGFFFAEILSLIGNKLNPFLAYRLKKEIFRRVINPYKNHTFWWEGAKMNWSSVCAGSVGAAAIYLIEDDDELSVILQRVMGSMETFIEAFDKDGLITEGLSYWSYGVSFYVYFAELLKDRTIGRISLLENNEKLIKIAKLPTYLQFPSEKFVTFSDSGNEKWRGDYGVLAKLEQDLNIKEYNYAEKDDVFFDKTYKWAGMSRKLFWGVDARFNKKNHTATGMKYFSQSQWLLDRRILSTGPFVAFAAKGGHNDEPHNHNDLGNFMLHYDGNNVFVDIGSQEYVKQYFRSETRYGFLLASSLGHSVPIINGCTQKYGEEYKAVVTNCEEKNEKTYYKLDLSKAYDCDGMVQYHREFIWDYKHLELEIKDYFGFKSGNNEIREVFITEVEPTLKEKGYVTYVFDNCTTKLFYKNEFQCVITKETYRNHDGKDDAIYKTCIFTREQASYMDLSFKINIIPIN